MITSTFGGNFKYNSSNKTKYIVLGEEIEIDDYVNSELAITISTLNVLGRPFYEELKKQNIKFPEKIEEVIKRNLFRIERETKIDKIIK